ncbi:MAG: FtsX-like permease family protein [Gammaproteobacteria bacterium]|nr:FtsX-like permease family protein [Gammaproteobacteria bacterium]
MKPRLVWRMALRDWRAGELLLLVIALVIAVGTVTAISLFVDRLHQALLSESAHMLAADRYITSSDPLPPAFTEQARNRGITTSDVMVFPSMVFAGEDRNQLVSVKAVTTGYPLRGKLIVGSSPFQRGAPTTELPVQGEVWLDSRLFPALGIQIGDTVEVGMKALAVTRVLVAEPDRGGSFFDMGPRLLMHLDDVPATEVVQPGSRLNYRLLMAGPDAALDALKDELELAAGHRWVGIRDASPRIGNALDRAESFLLLGGLLGVLLAGVAVALSAHRYARRHYDHVGVLKTLGATPAAIARGYLGLLLLVGAFAIAIGLIAGGLLHFGIVSALGALITVELPAPGIRPLFVGALTGLVCALAFALPPLIHLRNISPMRVIRRDLGGTEISQWITYGAAIAGSLGLLIWYTQSVMLTLWTLLGSVGVLLVFGALALGLLRGSRLLGMQAASLWRLALSGLQRRRRENIAQILIFGLAIMLLAVLTLLRTALLDDWRAQIPPDTPNHFVMNILPEEAATIDSMIDTVSTRRGGTYPIVRGRVTAHNDRLATEVDEARKGSTDEQGTRLGSERNLTWSDSMPEDNEMIEGDWWPADEKANLVSLEVDYAREFGISVGDTLRFDIAGSEVTAQVASLRKLDWESMKPNFFLIFSPPVLSEYPATYMTSFHLDGDNKIFLNALLSKYPTVTVLEIDAVIEQVQRIVDRVTQAVELILALVLASGCLVLLASIQASRDSRQAEHALLRAIGGTQRLIRGALTIEFAVLGGMAGFVAAAGAETTVAILHYQVFDLPVTLHPLLWLAAPLTGALIIGSVGLAGTSKLVSTPPMQVLRG